MVAPMPMTHLRRSLRAASIVFGLAASGALQAAAPASTDLWGGPAAKGAGTNARFDTNIYVSSVGAATGSIDFLVGGSTLTSVPFTLSTRGVAVVPAPAAVDGMGAFLYHLRSDAPVNAWSETFNDTPGGRFGTVTTAFPVSDFLAAGDESWGGGADASSSTAPGRARTNVGVLCSPLSAQGCTVEVTPFDGGVALGAAQIFAVPGSAAQQSLASLVPATAERSQLALRFRMLVGAGLPYAIKNDNLTSDGSSLSLSVSRGAFSTAPVIDNFTISPSSGCPPLTVTATWSTTGADHVNITGAAGALATSGTATFQVVSAGDITLTAVALSGATSTATRKVALTPPTTPPAPTPASATLGLGQFVQGSIPSAYSGTLVTITFDKHESTGSTFKIIGNQFTYTAGSATGTDIVRLTVPGGACGPGTATFTATVIEPGDPVIDSFTADPSRGCGASSNIVLTWRTENTSTVTIDHVTAPFGLSPNGSVGTTITATTTFTLNAYPLLGGDPIQQPLLVPVDSQPYVPILTPSSVSVLANSGFLLFTATGVPDPTLLRYVLVQSKSGGQVSFTDTPGTFAYLPGPFKGVDIVRIFFTNGCGPQYSVFTATVN
ncbi:MAG: hypothetical protein ACHQM4_11565 [Thermoanaerobaculia bacterium]